ncbi:MAG: DinB family protein [Bryobacteraceae bacterium]
MQYDRIDIPAREVPRAAAPALQHLLDTYASETNKTASVWRAFTADDLVWRPHPRSSTIGEIMKHQLLSEHRFFGDFLGSPEPPAPETLPVQQTIDGFTLRLVQLASARLSWLSARTEAEWLQTTTFFDVQRERIWVFWRRILHSAHHRTQLTVYLRLLNRTVPAIYGPTADVSWSGADPTLTAKAAERRG